MRPVGFFPRVAALGLAAVAFGAYAMADTITLTNGRVIEADRAWVEGKEVRYEKDGGVQTKWWLFALIKDGKLDVAICDRGMGIPTSLREKPEMATVIPILIRKLRKRVASGLIEIAVESSRSRTKLPHRGKGLPDMLTFSKQETVGGIFIMSHHGYFVYNSQFGSEVARDFHPPLEGTLITWHIPVQGQT